MRTVDGGKESTMERKATKDEAAPKSRAERETELRKMLDGGGCVLVGEKWFGPEATEEERRRYAQALDRRQRRNARRRARRMAHASLKVLERRLEALPAWAQTRLTGRTATVETVGGVRRRVDYSTAYGQGRDPFEYPFPGGRTPLELAVDGGIAAWTFVRRAHRLLAGPRRGGGGTADGRRSGRLWCERRKLCARSTLANRPTATDVRVAWAFARESHEGMLRLGGLLHDLECHLANGLEVIHVGRRPKIVGRAGGVRGWIRQNCPELSGKYKTLMRYKALALRLRQAAEIADPVPTSAALEGGADAGKLLARSAKIQPRAGGGRVERFAWERGRWSVDANGRPFRTNGNYSSASLTVSLALAAAEGHAATKADKADADALGRLRTLLGNARETVRGILAAAAEADDRRGRRTATLQALQEQVDRALIVRERWWEDAMVALR